MHRLYLEDHLKLVLILTRLIFCNFTYFDRAKSAYTSDYSLKAKVQIATWYIFVGFLTWDLFPRLTTPGSIWIVLAALFEYTLLIFLLTTVPTLAYFYQDVQLKLIAEVAALENQFISVGVNRSLKWKFSAYRILGLSWTILCVVAAVFYLYMLFFISLRSATKSKLLCCVIYGYTSISFIMLLPVMEYLRELNDALQDGSVDSGLICTECYNLNVNFNFENVCPFHRLSCAILLYENVYNTFKSCVVKWKFFYFVYMFTLTLECGVDLSIVLKLIITRSFGFNPTTLLHTSYSLLTILAVTILGYFFEDILYEMSKAEKIVHKYYLRNMNMNGMKELVGIFSTVLLDNLEIKFYVYETNLATSLECLNLAMVVASQCITVGFTN